MKKISMIASILTASLMLTSVSTFAADLEEGAATDSVGFKSTFSLPTEGIDLNTELSSLITYPEKAIEQGIEGEVLVLCTVNEQGRVSDVKILKDIGGDCALVVAQAVRNMQFQPAVQNGFARPFTMTIPVQFSLKN